MILNELTNNNHHSKTPLRNNKLNEQSKMDNEHNEIDLNKQLFENKIITINQH